MELYCRDCKRFYETDGMQAVTPCVGKPQRSPRGSRHPDQSTTTRLTAEVSDGDIIRF